MLLFAIAKFSTRTDVAQTDLIQLDKAHPYIYILINWCDISYLLGHKSSESVCLTVIRWKKKNTAIRLFQRNQRRVLSSILTND